MRLKQLGSEVRERGRALAASWPPSESASRAAARLRDALPSAADARASAREALERVPSPAEVWEEVRPQDGLRLFLSALVSGTVASLVSAGVLAGLARAEGKAPLQPLNATSHWLHGSEAGRETHLDLRHTGVGFLIHHASAVFWALPFQWWLDSRAERTPGEIVAAAGTVAGVAALVDYGGLPRRATPGWEHALSPRSMVLGFAALAAGLAAGGLLTEALRHR